MFIELVFFSSHVFIYFCLVYVFVVYVFLFVIRFSVYVKVFGLGFI
jgi:hypothetical protein